MNAFPNLIWIFLITCYIIIVGVTVIERYQKSRRYSFEGNSKKAQKNFLLDDKTRLVIVQCLLYAIWFLNVGIWVSICSFFRFAGRDFEYLGRQFWILSMTVICFPLQGFVNFCIYIRPRYMAIRQGPLREHGFWFAMREALWYPVESRIRRSSRAYSSRPSISESGGSRGQELTVAGDKNISGTCEMSELGAVLPDVELSGSKLQDTVVCGLQVEHPHSTGGDLTDIAEASMVQRSPPNLFELLSDEPNGRAESESMCLSTSKSVRFSSQRNDESASNNYSGLKRHSSLPDLRSPAWSSVESKFSESVQTLFGLQLDS